MRPHRNPLSGKAKCLAAYDILRLSQAMKITKTAAFLGLIGLSLAGAPVWSADHKEAPLINEDPAADLNDVYAYSAPGAPGRFVLMMTVNPFTPITAQLASNFSPNVRYRFAIDHNNDGVMDRDVEITFTPLVAGRQMFRIRLPNGEILTGQVTAPTTNAAANPAIIVSGPSGVTAFAGPPPSR